jgi:hypothetical protein
VYSTCLHCHKDLGANEILETLPVGRRIAFDAAQGRLWVICPACAKWNLVPFDTRLETIDACEQLFRDTRTRFSTDNIGLARLKDGTELVRVGSALRPEFAAWRYGRQFARRRRRALVGPAGAGLIRIVGSALGPGGILGGLVTAGVWTVLGGEQPLEMWRRRSVALLLARPDGESPLVMTRADLDDVRVAAYHDGWELAVADRRVRPGLKVTVAADLPDLLLRGPDAIRVLGRILPRIAGTAGSTRQVRSATELLERLPDVNAIIARHYKPFHRSLAEAGPSLRLALEMAAHEESEREALRGELKLLERDWQKAEELAKIADSLTLSSP